jgi:hypothetical protein
MRRDDLTFRNAWSWKWLLILTFGDSRKTAYALWAAVIATFLFLLQPIYLIAASLFRVPKDSMIQMAALLDAQLWFLIVSGSGVLFGWGTKKDKENELKKTELEIKKMEVQSNAANPDPS